ncbi:hypothetical protein [Amycolatopsis pithecellobii]|uniref:Uncharacterized protein n=1 Tax=Amycolatopsis pithecellobii TaxID=664692 RepID=A0A6N7Z8M5_9PSEU|nr:hypothetical protein [Amycolatopsis pithecellobii]MTD58141.1 hypothetical protein [Amycolatopsis pithecellobii]
MTTETGYQRDRIPLSRHKGGYDVLVKMYVKKGTEQKLLEAGARDKQPSNDLARRGLDSLPVLERGNGAGPR